MEEIKDYQLDLEETLIPGNNKVYLCSQEPGLLQSCTEVQGLLRHLTGFKIDCTHLTIGV